MPSPAFRLTCCLGGEVVPSRTDVWAVDEVWQRRFPAMVGTLSCLACLSENRWQCVLPDGGLAEGHPSGADPDRCSDSYGHTVDNGTQIGMLLAHPWSGVVQGAEEYLRWSVASHPRGRHAALIRAALCRWDSGSYR